MSAAINVSGITPEKSNLGYLSMSMITFYLLILLLMFHLANFTAKFGTLLIYLFLMQYIIIYLTLAHRESVTELPDFAPIKADLNKKFSTIKDILLKEFKYAQETAAQAMNDRHTLVNYFLIIIGAIFSFNFAFLKDGIPPKPYHFTIIQITALMCNFIGWIYFFKIVRLRQAWIESARAMNHIKALFLYASGIRPEKADFIFRWKPKTLPRANKSGTVFHYSAVLLAFFTAVTFSLSVLAAVEFKAYYWFALSVGGYHFLFQNLIYFIALAEIKEKKRAG
ncbi:hypothetical protein L0128_02460 [candidate division KSB1 bacterium]|nr:hypothetical protein [candidate division KSB1 bacterium]